MRTRMTQLHRIIAMLSASYIVRESLTSAYDSLRYYNWLLVARAPYDSEFCGFSATPRRARRSDQRFKIR